MRKSTMTALGILAALAVLPAQAGQILTFDVPGAGTGTGEGTRANAINGNNVMAGTYEDDNLVVHAFFGPANGPFTTFDAPGAGTDAGEGTTAAAINLAGTVAGNFHTSGSKGYVRDAKGNFATFDPGNGFTVVTALSAKGVVAGATRTESFVRNPNGKITLFQVPGATSTSAYAINGSNTVAGIYSDSSSHSHGFIRTRRGDFTTFDVPGGYTNIEVKDINDNGDVAGDAVLGGSRSGFLRKADGTYAIFAVEGCFGTFVTHVNFAGVVIGNCYDNDGGRYGFLRQPDGTITRFDALGGDLSNGAGTYPTGIAADGKIAGLVEDANGVMHGFRRNAGN